jgi:hypothetical protein
MVRQARNIDVVFNTHPYAYQLRHEGNKKGANPFPVVALRHKKTETLRFGLISVLNGILVCCWTTIRANVD